MSAFMNDFRTKIKLPQYSIALHHQHQILTFGSCFAENIGRRLQQLKFQIHNNPFGILYNPIAIINNLQRLLENQAFTADELFENNGIWHSWAHHSSYSNMDKNAALAAIQQNFNQTKSALNKTNRLILTFGTAYVFEYIKTGQIVANCHQIPQKNFRKRILSIDEITSNWLPFLLKLKMQNPDLEVIISVSPIRHLRDGLLENQQSKATLLLVAGALATELPFVHYFPAYEIMMDDLRDYRFYEADMLHPNSVAIDYIWQGFQDSFFDKNTQTLIVAIQKIIAAGQHRPFHPNSSPHQQFLENQTNQIAQLKENFPFLDFTEEIRRLEQQKK